MDSAGRHSPFSGQMLDTGLGQAINRGSPDPVIEMRSLMARERITAQPR
jgi:hypothetical protein